MCGALAERCAILAGSSPVAHSGQSGICRILCLNRYNITLPASPWVGKMVHTQSAIAPLLLEALNPVEKRFIRQAGTPALD